MGKTLDYIITNKKTGRLSFRRRYPADLRPFVPTSGKKDAWELRVMLGDTRLTSAALERYRAAEQRYEAIERQALQAKAGSQKPLDEAIIRYLADIYIHAEIDLTNRARGSLQEVEDLRPYAPRRDLEADWEASRELLDDDSYDLRGIIDMWGEWAQGFARAYGYTVTPGSQSLTDLCLALADAACRLWLVVDPHRSLKPIKRTPKAPQRPEGSLEAPAALPAPGTAPVSGKTVRNLLDHYEARKGEKWANSSRLAFAPVRRLLEGRPGAAPAAAGHNARAAACPGCPASNRGRPRWRSCDLSRFPRSQRSACCRSSRQQASTPHR